jgi:membrane protein
MAPDVRTAGPDAPTDLSGRSWMATLKRTFKEFQDDNLTDWAAALTYYGVLALFPAIIALVSILGLVVSPPTITKVLTQTISSLGPSSAVNTFKGPVDSIANSRSTAGVLLIVGLLGALWSASGYVGAFSRASNAIYERAEGRKFYLLRPLQVLVTLILILMAACVVIALIVSGPLATSIGNAIGIGSTALTVWNIAKWPVMLVVVMVMLAILYYASPNAKHPKFKWISPGSAVAVVLWVIASALFAFYVANFGSYNKTYGALGGVVVFLVWMWITNLAVLFGAELNAEIERGREIAAGVPGAHDDIQLPYRSVPKGEEQRGRFERDESAAKRDGDDDGEASRERDEEPVAGRREATT